MVLEADRNGCLREVLVIASALSIQDPRERPAEHAAAADQLHTRFADPSSDFLAFVSLWQYLRDQRHELSSGQFRRMCRREHLNFLRVREWQDVHSQLCRVAAELGMRQNRTAAEPDAIHRSLLAGLLSHIGQKDRDTREYAGARNARFAIFPGSSLAKKPPAWVMAAELVETSRLWGRTAARIRPEWAEALAGHLVKRSYSEPHWSTKRAAAMVYERVTLYGLPIVNNRLVGHARIDAEDAWEMFVRHALVEGDWNSQHRFIKENQALLGEVEELEHRYRRRDLVVGSDTLERLYRERVPRHVVSGRHFDSWWKSARRAEPGLLTFDVDDLLQGDAGDLSESDFPAEWHQGELTFGLSYAFAPGTADDGVAAHIPVAVLNQVRPVGFDWQIPGLREELVVELIRSLPKPLRRNLLPVQATARAFLDRVEPMGSPLLEALGRELTRVGGERIRRDDWDLARLPAHLRLKFLVVADDGTVLREGEDIEAMKAALSGEVRRAIADASPGVERRGFTEWSFGDVPRVLERTSAGQSVKAYPAVVDEGDTVAIRVFDDPSDQHAAMWDGNRRLLVTAALDELMADAGGPARDAVRFDALRGKVAAGLRALTVQIVGDVARILSATREIDRRLDDVLEPVATPVAADVAAQRHALVYDGFVPGVGRGRMADILRYLDAILIRLDKHAEAPGSDRRRMESVHRVQARYNQLLDAIPDGVAPDDEVIEIAWLIEELRVSLFAQALGTPQPVSEKRLLDLIGTAR